MGYVDTRTRGLRLSSKYEDVLNVRLQAPFLVRVERVMARENIDNRLRAEQRVKADDTARQKFVSMFYNQGMGKRIKL